MGYELSTPYGEPFISVAEQQRPGESPNVIAR